MSELPLLAQAMTVAQAIRTLVTEKIPHLRLFDTYPLNMVDITELGLEIPVVERPTLTVQDALHYLCAFRGDSDLEADAFAAIGSDRGLYGLLYVGPPTALIFLRQGLAPALVSYVLAHEIGHYLADVLLVKQRWLAAFPDIPLAVHEAFTWSRLDPHLELRALLSGLPRRPPPILARGRATDPVVTEREILADLIARELLAPWARAAAVFHEHLTPATGATQARSSGMLLLQNQFHLPQRVAEIYWEDLERALRPPPGLLDRLFGPLTQQPG